MSQTDTEKRLAAIEARLAALEAERRTATVTHYVIQGNSPPLDQCPYCYQPLSRCRGHNICAS